MPTQNPRLTITLKPSTAALMRRMSELTGAKDISVKQTKCSARGEACCEWQLNWR